MWVAILGSVVAVLVSLHFLINWSAKRSEIDVLVINSTTRYRNKNLVPVDLLFHVFGILLKHGEWLKHAFSDFNYGE